MEETEMARLLRQQSYSVQENVPEDVITSMVAHFLGTTDFEEFETILKRKAEFESHNRKLIESCKSLDWFHDILETNLGGKYITAQLGFPTLQKDRTGTGVHYDRTQAFFDTDGENIVQCWIPVWEQNMPESGLRVYPRFVSGKQVYNDDSYREFVNPKKRRKGGRELVSRYEVPEHLIASKGVDFTVRDHLGHVIWFNSNCLHCTVPGHDPRLPNDKKRIAIAIRFVRQGCRLRPGLTLEDLFRMTRRKEYLRSAIAAEYFNKRHSLLFFDMFYRFRSLLQTRNRQM